MICRICGVEDIVLRKYIALIDVRNFYLHTRNNKENKCEERLGLYLNSNLLVKNFREDSFYKC